MKEIKKEVYKEFKNKKWEKNDILVDYIAEKINPSNNPEEIKRYIKKIDDIKKEYNMKPEFINMILSTMDEEGKTADEIINELIPKKKEKNPVEEYNLIKILKYRRNH